MTINNIRHLLKHLKAYKRDLGIVLLSIFGVSGALLALGYAVRKLVDNALRDNQLAAINHYVLLICLGIVIFGVSSFFRSYLINKVTEQIINKIRTDAYQGLLHLEIFHFEELKISEIISCLTADLELISKLIIDLLSSFIRNSVMLMGSIALMFVQSYKLSLIVTFIIPLWLLPLLKLSKYVRTLTAKSRQAQDLITADLEETFANIRTVYSFNQQNNKIAAFHKQTTLYLDISSKRLRVRCLFFSLAITLILFSITIVVWVGSSDIINSNISAGQLISFVYYSVIAGFSAGGLAELASEIHKPLIALARVYSLSGAATSLLSNTSSSSVKMTTPSFFRLASPLSLEFQNVDFSYPARPSFKVLDNISIKILSNKFIAIVGRSGSGKSTLIQLLLKFYCPNRGGVRINNQDISTLNTKELRKLFGYAAQEASIFSGTIRSNLAISNPDAKEEEINHIAKLTGIMDFASKFKDGIDSKVGEKGLRLSGGQKQRLAIARALLCRPEFLRLDEATSNLDSEGEQRLLIALRQLMQGKTIIVITHRLASVEKADEIFVIEKGKLEASGSHSELLQKSEIYRLLCAEQKYTASK